MAAKIGYVSFSAFELRKADEFVSIKRKAYDTADPTKSWFDRNPPIPPWQNGAHVGIEPAMQKTPSEFVPLMNEYHRFFLERSVEQEHYLRWLKRHRAWDRETEVHFRRFQDLRDHLNDRFAREDYTRRGRLHQIYDQATQKTWMQTDRLNAVSEREALEAKRRNALLLQKKLESEALYRNTQFEVPNERAMWKSREEVQKVSATSSEEKIAISVRTDPGWAHALALSHYQQAQGSIPVAPPPLATQTASTMQTALAPPVIKKVHGLG